MTGQRAEAVHRRRHLGWPLHRRRWARRSWNSGVINASIHKVNEYVRVADIDALHRMYVRRAAALLLEPAAAQRWGRRGRWR